MFTSTILFCYINKATEIGDALENYLRSSLSQRTCIHLYQYSFKSITRHKKDHTIRKE